MKSYFLKNLNEELNVNEFLNQIKDLKGDRRSFDKSYFDLSKPDFNEIGNSWLKAGIDPNTVEWFNFYSGIDFDENFTHKFSKLVNAKPIKVWVSKINSAKSFPRHVDADTNRSNFNEEKMVRYHMHLDDYSFGHYFVLEDLYISNYKQGDVYKWRNYLVWHAGGNVGFKPKFMFNFLGEEL